MLYWHGVRRSGSTNAAKIECTHRRACKLLTDYMITVVHQYPNTYILNFNKYFKDKLSSHQPSHMNNSMQTQNNSNFNTPLFNNSKTQKRYLYQVIPIWNSLPKFLKNCTSRFTFKKQIKSLLLASQS